MTTPVTPAPSDVRQKARLVRIEAHEESVAPWRPELLDAAAMLDAFADLLEARAARPSPWQKVTRVEVIAERGRAFTRWDCHLEHTDSMFQDDGRTLKLFVKGGTPTSPPAQGRRTAAVNELPSIEEMAGSVSDVTGGQTLEEFMRWLRDE